MSTKFSLTVTIEGDSLDQVDELLISAATKRLMSRMTTPPKLNGEVLHRGETVNMREEAKRAADKKIRDDARSG